MPVTQDCASENHSTVCIMSKPYRPALNFSGGALLDAIESLGSVPRALFAQTVDLIPDDYCREVIAQGTAQHRLKFG